MTDLIRRDFVQNQQMVVPNAGQLFITTPIANGMGNSKHFDEVDTETFAANKRQGESAKKMAVGVGYNVEMFKKRIAAEIEIAQELRDENRYQEVGSLITSLVHYCPQRIELDMSHILTFCSASTYTDKDGDTWDLTVGDAVALVSTTHYLKFSSDTWSNRVTGDPIFSRGGLEAAEALAVTNVKSNLGERRVFKFNAIVTTDDPNTCNAVRQFFGSPADVDAVQAGVMNVYKGKYEHIVLPYLATTATGARDTTKERWWFLVAKGQGMLGWQAYYGVWEAPHMKDLTADDRGANHDYSRDIWRFGSRAGYGIRAVTGRGIVGSLPTS
jgi:hypothetical protein